MKKQETEKCSACEITTQDVIKSLRERKFKITNQRRILLDIILEGDCTCCKEIYDKAAKKDSGIGVATVYRMVHALEDVGAIKRSNQYRINCRHEENGSKMCRIVLDDQTEVELSEQKWKQVVVSGLKCCGMLNDQNLKSIELAGNILC